MVLQPILQYCIFTVVIFAAASKVLFVAEYRTLPPDAIKAILQKKM